MKFSDNRETSYVCETLMPPENNRFSKSVTLGFDLDLANDLDLGTNRCVSMRRVFVPNVNLVTKLV